MFLRVYNPSDLTQYYDARDQHSCFMLTDIPWPLTDSTVNFRPSEYFKWLKAMWDHEPNHDTLKMFIFMRNTGLDPETAQSHPYAHIWNQVFANRPKWWTEFFHIELDSYRHTFCLTYCLPVAVDTGLSYYDSKSSTRISYTTPNILDDIYPVDSVTISNMDTVNSFFDEFERKLTHYLEAGDSRNRAKNINTLTNNGTFTRVLVTLTRFLTNNMGVRHESRNGREDLIPSQMLNLLRARMSTSPDMKHTYSCTVQISSDGGINIRYKEPRGPASRQQLSTILNYSTNVLDYLPFNIRSPKEAKAPLYGIELETATDYRPADVIAAQSELFFICKSDGTISGHGVNKYEMVTVPATFKAHKRLWADWFNKLDYTKFDTSKNTGNGMHVHVERKAFFDSRHLNRFSWFFINPANYDFMFEISERPNKSEFQRWAPTPHFGEGRSKTKTMRNAVAAHRNLRGIIHFKSDVTVEVRMFKGVVSYATIMKNLEFVDSVFHFTTETTLLQTNLKSYLAWLDRQPSNRYGMLRKFIAESTTMSNILFNNEIKEYLFTDTKPEVIIKKLSKAPFQVTNKHITALNREKRKRTFILNKDGTITLAYTTGGKLAALDKELQAKMTRGSSSIVINQVA